MSFEQTLRYMCSLLLTHLLLRRALLLEKLILVITLLGLLVLLRNGFLWDALLLLSQCTCMNRLWILRTLLLLLEASVFIIM